jgi:hypothetical protein
MARNLLSMAALAVLLCSTSFGGKSSEEAQPQAASHGVTLTAADTVIFWSPVMSVETYLQCIARIDRVGQVNNMTVVHLQGSEVERKMYAMLQGKVNNHEKLVDLYKEELGIK